ncbi:hypothetical protein P9578_27585 [Brevibacillus choshinensis]|nr:hypothetical protein [Brevibacillus choshinensis]
MAMSRSERNESRRDVRLEKAQVLAAQQAKAQADARKQTSTRW